MKIQAWSEALIENGETPNVKLYSSAIYIKYKTYNVATETLKKP